jgi:hypothetical protein
MSIERSFMEIERCHGGGNFCVKTCISTKPSLPDGYENQRLWERETTDTDAQGNAPMWEDRRSSPRQGTNESSPVTSRQRVRDSCAHAVS